MGQMPSIKANVGISTAVVTAVGGIITAWIMHQPTPSPQTQNAAHSSAVGHVHVSDSGVSAYVYDAPVEDGTTGRIGELSNGQLVEILCTVQGPEQTSTNGTSTVWDKITYNGRDGYLNDAEVNTNSDQAVAAPCS